MGSDAMKKFTLERDKGNFIRGIRYGKQWVLLLTEGAIINEHYAKWVVKVLNGERLEPPGPIKVKK